MTRQRTLQPRRRPKRRRRNVRSSSGSRRLSKGLGRAVHQGSPLSTWVRGAAVVSVCESARAGAPTTPPHTCWASATAAHPAQASRRGWNAGGSGRTSRPTTTPRAASADSRARVVAGAWRAPLCRGASLSAARVRCAPGVDRASRLPLPLATCRPPVTPEQLLSFVPLPQPVPLHVSRQPGAMHPRTHSMRRASPSRVCTHARGCAASGGQLPANAGRAGGARRVHAPPPASDVVLRALARVPLPPLLLLPAGGHRGAAGRVAAG